MTPPQHPHPYSPCNSCKSRAFVATPFTAQVNDGAVPLHTYPSSASLSHNCRINNHPPLANATTSPNTSPPTSSRLPSNNRRTLYQTAPSNTGTSPKRFWSFLNVTNSTLTCTALGVALVFGVGAWVGQNYANSYARKSYELSLWGICVDHQVSAQCISCFGVALIYRLIPWI